jgi:endonuclease/exonuclease/phosphatase family metal-dependent hydrolase
MSRSWAAVALCLAVGCAAGSPPLPESSALVPGARLRVVSLNVAGGAGPRWRTAEAHAEQRAYLAAIDPDVVCLQEVRGSPAPYWHADGWSRFWSEGPIDGEPSGIALWVRSGLRQGESWVVPVDFAATWARAAIFVEVEGVRVACTHLDAGPAAAVADIRRRDLEEIYAYPPDLLVGDMNDLTDTVGSTAGKYAASLTPMGSIDQAWSRIGGSARLALTYGEDKLVSDHTFAVIAEVELP